MKIVLLLALSTGLAAVLQAAPNQYPVSKEMARRAIVIFRQQPTSEQGQGAGSMVLHFAQESPDVEVVVSMEAFPWFHSKRTYKYSGVLLEAYFVGTVRSQLEHGVTKNDPVAGAEQVIETYQQLKKADPKYSVPEVEKLVELKDAGKLKEYVKAHDKA